MSVKYSSYSGLGHRENNEDAYAVFDTANGFLAIAADGLGGHNNGEYASRQAVETISTCLADTPLSEDAVEDAIIKANEDICLLQHSKPEAKTTIALLWTAGESAIVANVGDTRIYQFRDGRIVYQSTDHSVAQLSVIAGEITAEDIRKSPDRNRLTRSLGQREAPWIDIVSLKIRPGDRFLLCSDGFWESVTEDQMLQGAAEDVDAWLSEMRFIAESRAHDNNTAIAVFY